MSPKVDWFSGNKYFVSTCSADGVGKVHRVAHPTFFWLGRSFRHPSQSVITQPRDPCPFAPSSSPGKGTNVRQELVCLALCCEVFAPSWAPVEHFVQPAKFFEIYFLPLSRVGTILYVINHM